MSICLLSISASLRLQPLPIPTISYAQPGAITISNYECLLCAALCASAGNSGNESGAVFTQRNSQTKRETVR